MLTVIWVLGTMILMLLIHLLIPLGYTKKGKFVIVVFSGLLALGGLAAATAFPLWQAILTLVALSFLAAYIMDSRLGKVMYMTKEQYVEENEIEDSATSFILTKQSEKTIDIEFMDLTELEVTASSHVIQQEVDSISAESIDEDISFLQDRDIESDRNEILVDDEFDVSYLSDIESLLEESLEEKVKLQEEQIDSRDEEGWLDELAELSIVKDEEKGKTEEPQRDDFELEEIFTDKKVAAASDNDENKPLKVLQLQN
ncbi:hypothetical protein [Neobacillus niacini]|uniref:hypothetical protein n=1 Tax=Neobacillus niacini TaxID=86668 RepID=UPI002FFF2211